MTLFRMVLRELLCDYPNCTETDGTGGADWSAEDLRRDMKAKGWVQRGKRDLCPQHAEMTSSLRSSDRDDNRRNDD